MKFGVREICDVVFKAKSKVDIGTLTFLPGQPVLYIDTAKTSTVESAATTVYAQGGKGNSRLVAWEGEKTLTFTVEDALLSPIGFAVLSGADLIKASSAKKIQVHTTAKAYMDKDGNINLKDRLENDETINANCPVFVATLDRGSIGQMVKYLKVADTDSDEIKKGKALIAGTKPSEGEDANYSYKDLAGDVFVDFYVDKATVTELSIDAGNFAGYYYVEASTLFRREADGVDMPAEIIIPNVKIQSNFTFSMASSGDPSTFTFTMDAFPGYTRFDRTKKVLCAIQIIDESGAAAVEGKDSIGLDADDEGTYPVKEQA